jgi:5-methylcytosine-specific restriction endonuclease McrA
MSYKDRHIDRKRARRSSPKNELFHHDAETELAIEKSKARELRNSPWWKNKIAAGECYYCGKIISPSDLTMDHKIPLARGGKSEKINLVPACKECNNKKKYMLPTEWEEYMDNIKNNRI